MPGFNIESDRYRAETIIKLQKTQTTLICIGTDESFKKSDIPVNTSESICSISIAPEVKKDRDEIVESLVSWGYKKTDTVFGPMEFAVRGEIVDIFPNHFRQPIRIVFNYDIVENIYIFDQSTQLTTKSLPKLNIKGRAVSVQTLDFISLTDYSRDGIIIDCKYKDGLIDFFHNVPGEPISLDIFPIELKNISIKNRINKINDLIIKNSNVFIVGGEREKSILDEKFKDAIWLSGNIKTGFHSSFLNCFVISSSDVLNERKSFPKWEPPQAKRHENITRNDLSSLAYGDLVVHKTFGVGYFRGLTLQSNSVGDRESVEIEYKKNTRVFISLEKMDLIHRYIGSNNNPPISSLGSKKWTGEIAKAKKSIQLVAQELLELYANKNRKRTFRYIEENDIDDALAKSFPFIETPDQQKAISDILTDMNGDSPVDRLICGDVGFGKTEVALRAILKAVLSNKQTTFLCPTTILADQHFITCKERLEPLGVTIGLLSRFKTKKEQGEIIKSLRNGGIDVLIGTHRVLSQDVVIPNLGLLVVDEEHRFGVNHKEKIRTMKQQIDVLTLSATPIPRTLQQSLVGIRDMSLIQTPPRSRKPIETVIRYFDWEAIVLYVEREVSRGGQVYFLHNDIKSLPYFTKKLQNIFPNVSVENIHGQLGSKELESKILSFFKGGIDILVCTTIIESGLDVTNANCIIINDAQNFGLSQLYQIRGRVGRGFNQAHCLLLIPRTKLEKNAHRRLKTIEQYTSLGSGYDVSMKDLEIRGAGSLFGYKQSGHISTIGFELYCELLKNEVDLVMGKDE
ncbi:MAG: DEAD/DEAH box helicase, partial [Candidatus Marinimicrobia bacterium]|nr:DEAD/DEAH box helicase [Candidatus Neomarinimicrobiota bacterium]